MIKFKTTSPEQTEKFGYELAKSLVGGDVIALTGDLGAGKTCLTRGIAGGLGSTSHVSSPTFTIVNEYEGGRLMLFHFDTYRLSGPDDFLMSGLDEYFYRDGVCVIEWSDIIEELLPQDTIRMTITGDGNVRNFECECGEKHSSYILEAAKKSGAENKAESGSESGSESSVEAGAENEVESGSEPAADINNTDKKAKIDT